MWPHDNPYIHDEYTWSAIYVGDNTDERSYQHDFFGNRSISSMIRFIDDVHINVLSDDELKFFDGTQQTRMRIFSSLTIDTWVT